MKSSKSRVFLALGLLIILVLIGAFIYRMPTKQTNTLVPNLEFQSSKPVATDSSLDYKCEKGKNVFELLQHFSSDLGFKETSLGKLVTRINAIEQGNGKYWLYKVNQKEATIGAEAYVCQDNEDILWELR